METIIQTKLAAFFERYPKKSFKKHEIMIAADQDPVGIFYLTSGVVRRYGISPHGEELTINIFQPISFFPMSWAINQMKNRHYFEAMTPVITYVAPPDAVMAFLKQEPDVVLDLMSRVYKGLEGVMEHMEYLMVGNAYNRLIVILIIAAKRFGKTTATGIKIELPMTHTDLATQAGMSRETVTRELKILKDNGIASYEKDYIIVHDLDKLEQALLN